MSILSYLIPYTAVGSCAGQLFLALKVSTFPLGPLLRAHAKVTLSSYSFQYLGLEHPTADSKTKPNGLLAKHGRWKFPLSPGLPTTTQVYMWVTKETLGKAVLVQELPLSIPPCLPATVILLLCSGLQPQGSQLYPNLSQNWVTGSESGIRVAVTCRQFQWPHLPPVQPCWWENLQENLRITCNGVLREATADFTL